MKKALLVLPLLSFSVLPMACDQSQSSHPSVAENTSPVSVGETEIQLTVSLDDYNRIYKEVLRKPEVTVFDYSSTERWMLHSSSLESDHIVVSFFLEGDYTARKRAHITVKDESLPEVAKPKIVDLATYNKLLKDNEDGYTMSTINGEPVYLMGFPEDFRFLKLYDFSDYAHPFEVLVK